MLRSNKVSQVRDTTNDARVTPNYQEYVDNPGVCAGITEPSWDPPSNTPKPQNPIYTEDISD